MLLPRRAKGYAKRIIKEVFLNRLPVDTIVPMFGANRGRRWLIGSGNHNYWLGRDEKGVQESFKRYISEGDVVYDIGSHVGFYTLLASRLVGPSGRVYAFEPVPRNFDYLLRHLRINKVENAVAFPLALSDHSGEAAFEEGSSTSTGHIAAQGGLRVVAMSFDDFVEKHKAPLPDFVKLDVEGHELNVLKGMARVLEAKKHITFTIEANEERTDIFEFLEEKGYVVTRIGRENVLCIR